MRSLFPYGKLGCFTKSTASAAAKKADILCRPGIWAFMPISPFSPFSRKFSGSVESLILNGSNAIDHATVKTCIGTQEEVQARLEEFKKLYPDLDQRNDAPYKYMVLAKTGDAKRVVSINAPIINDKKAYSGRSFAFVLKQTYIPIDELRAKTKTSELSQL